MAKAATIRRTARRTKVPPDHRQNYAMTSMCEVCERPIVTGQTWKYTPAGGKVHYYCAKANPEYETMKSRLEGEGRRIARSLHPDEWGQPVSYEYFTFKLYQDPEAVIPGWSGMLPQEKNRATRQLWGAYQREARKILEAGRVGNPAGSTYRVTFDDLSPAQQHRAFITYRFDTGDTDSDETVRRAVFYGFDWDSRTGKPWSTKNPAGPTVHQAMLMARAAGARIGDTSGFEPWLKKAKLEGRSPMLRESLRKEFWEGVDKGPTKPMSKEEAQSAKAFASGGEVYKGTRIWPYRQVWGQKEVIWKTDADPLSDFDSREDARRFVDAQRNPNPDIPRFVPAEDDWPIGPIKWTVIDTLVGRKVQIGVGGGLGIGSLRPKQRSPACITWIRVGSRQAAERIADKLNRQERKRRVA